MKHSRSVMLFATASLAISGLAYCIFNPAWAVMLAMIASLLLGWFSGLKTSKELRVLALMLLAATCLVAMVFFLNNSLFQKGPLYAIAALAPFSFYLASAIRGGDATAKSGYLTMFGLGWVAGFAQSAFNFLSIEDFGLMGYAIIYGMSGYLFGIRSEKALRQFLFLSPILVIAELEPLSTGTPFNPFTQLLVPSIPVASMIVGNIAAHKGRAGKGILIAFCTAVTIFAFVFVPRWLDNSSWENHGMDKQLPPIKLIGLTNDTLDNQDLDHVVTWLELYTHTCRPCYDQMQSVERVANYYRDDDRVRFITVSSAFYEDYEAFLSAEAFHEFKLWHGYEFDSTLAQTFASVGVPVGLLVDKHGRVRFEKQGFSLQMAERFESGLTEKINDLLAEK